MANPITLAAIFVPPVAGAIYRKLVPDRAREIQKEVLEEQLGFARRLERMSRGVFTEAERKGIAAASEPQLNMLQGSLGSRGLGRSPAGAQIMVEAKQRPFLAMQQAALGAVPGAFGAAAGTAGSMPQDSFFDDLAAISQNLVMLQGLNQMNDPLVRDATKALYGGAFIDPMQGYSQTTDIVSGGRGVLA